MTESPLPQTALRNQREQTIVRLCEHFARDHLEAEELEALIDRAHQATTPAQLDALFQGLPTLDAPPTPTHELARDDERADQGLVIALMGGAERKGTWTPPRQLNVAAVMGGIDLDFRQARLGPGVTQVNVLAVMGGVDIIVPPGLRVESDGIGIMGGFSHTPQGKLPVDYTGPVLRVRGLAVMGGVEIRQRDPRGSARGRDRERLRNGGQTELPRPRDAHEFRRFSGPCGFHPVEWRVRRAGEGG